MSENRGDGPVTVLAIKAALAVLDDIDGGLEGLRREAEWADNADAQAAFDAVERLLVRVRCGVADVIDGEGGDA
jgi:hypothetical protein